MAHTREYRPGSGPDPQVQIAKKIGVPSSLGSGGFLPLNAPPHGPFGMCTPLLKMSTVEREIPLAHKIGEPQESAESFTPFELFPLRSVQGYFSHKKTPTPLGPP